MATETEDRARWWLADLEAEMNAIAMPDDWSPELDAQFGKVVDASTGDGVETSAGVDLPVPVPDEGR